MPQHEQQPAVRGEPLRVPPKQTPADGTVRHHVVAPATALALQRAAGNRAVANALSQGKGSSVQRDTGGAVGLKIAPTPVEFSISLPGSTLECGIKIDPKVVFKGEFAAVPSKADGTKVSAGFGGLRFKSGSEGSLSLFKGEVQQKLGQAGGSVKGSLDATPAGVTPAVELSGPLGLAGLELRLEFAPWKFKYDLDGKSSVKVLPMTVGVRRPGEFTTDNFSFKGSIGVDGEASIDPPTAMKYLAKRYAKDVGADAAAMGAIEAGLVAMVVGGAVLVGLDYIDEERRAKLLTTVSGRAHAIIDAESVYLTALTGRAVTPHGRLDVAAIAEANRARGALAAKCKIDAEVLACVSAAEPDLFGTFRWRDAELDALIRAAETGLDAWAKDHPVRSLWGLRVQEDKKFVRRRVDIIREDPALFKHPFEV